MTTPEPAAGPTGAVSFSPVSRTALAVARVRARESERPDALFTDPHAAAFLTAAGYPAEPAVQPGPYATAITHHTVIRTRFYDDFLLAACAAGCRQTVLLAAGLDTRAYRLAWPDGVRLYELDLPPVLAFKEHVLAGRAARPRCARTAVAADLLSPEWPALLAAAGFDPAARTAWLAEGLLVYLTEEQATGLLLALGGLSRPGDRFAMERGRDIPAAAAEPGLTHIAPLWRGGLGPGLGDWLGANGWDVATHPIEELSATYDRPGTGPARGGFHTATRR
ncbi:SAM-dependent methyltransferase [Streptomyces sp. NPDC001678]|uniref:SAM-dependent methyltransferase n=1 Tax=Streptomyces sp. NPDC001678 TaxID=3364599 RepID=UPI0036A5D62F